MLLVGSQKNGGRSLIIIMGGRSLIIIMSVGTIVHNERQKEKKSNEKETKTASVLSISPSVRVSLSLCRVCLTVLADWAEKHQVTYCLFVCLSLREALCLSVCLSLSYEKQK